MATKPMWEDLLLRPDDDEYVWPLFHENSKFSRYQSVGLSAEEVVAKSKQLYQSLPYEGYSTLPLPSDLPHVEASLLSALTGRVSTREFEPGGLTLCQLAALLRLSYGMTRNNREAGFMHPFRVVPSGGGLYPLEIYFHCFGVTGLADGIYHYDPTRHCVQLLKQGDFRGKVAEQMGDPSIVLAASVSVFITAVFARSTFKYRDRGYRFTLLEAGHVAQNLNLVASALGLGSVNIGGYCDRGIDRLLGLDGIKHSTVYMVAIGKKAEHPDRVGTVSET